ncbi:MAG: co-chaperone YbbN [Magnetococcales bacterium]|nr:co-chaperone YbbN [Magnetococcales bacterium]
MSSSPWIIEANTQNFRSQVVERSRTTPVLVDFWAPWCNPCRTLGPILEKLAREGEGRFVLAKVNSDQNPDLGRYFQVKSIPAVKLIINGQVVDEFTGALPESGIRKFLDKAIPSPEDRLAEQGMMLEESGDLNRAAGCYQAVLERNAAHAPSLLGMARIYLAAGEKEQAKAFLEKLPAKEAESPEAKSLKAQIEFDASDLDTSALEARIAADPGDLQARLDLGRALVGDEQFAAGMDQFLAVVRADRSFQEDAGRKAMLQVFDLLGPKHPLVVQYRSKLSSILFS